MSRRRPDETAIAESDSFLDIVANIVGILIILIVIVGVRVGQSTVAPPAPAVVENNMPARPAPVIAPTPIFVDAPPPPAPEPIPRNPKLLAAIETTTAELRRLERESRIVTDETTQFVSSLSNDRDHANEMTGEHAALKQNLKEMENAREDIAAKLNSLQETERNLREQLADVPESNVTVLKHELNPIGRSVRGEELHFRLAEGGISHIPLDDFIDRLKPRIEEQKDMVARFNRHEGRIGPFDGYSLEYVIERDKLSVVDELTLGRRVMRISVTGWKIVPEDTLVTESVEQALHANSRFQQVLRLADRDATLTFWVYPDSFDAYRKLQEFAHEQGFDVAARPLPEGVPIAGSPNGSHSSGQ